MIAVTGSNGLLGSFILRKFVEEKVPVIGLVREGSDLSMIADIQHKIDLRTIDILDPSSLLASLAGVQTVVHTAAMVSFNPRSSEALLIANQVGTRNLVNACLTLNIPTLLHISSVSALGRKKDIKNINESGKWEDSALNSDYAKSKYLAELEVYRGQEEGLKVALINPSVILAPGNPDKSSARIFQYAWSQKPFYINSQINYVDVRDVADMAFQIWKQDLWGEKFIASAGAILLIDLLTPIANRLSRRPPFIKINTGWVRIFAIMEEFRSRLNGTEPLVSRQSIKLSRESFFYENKKAIDMLGIQFRTLPETLDWCCLYYQRAFNTKN